MSKYYAVDQFYGNNTGMYQTDLCVLKLAIMQQIDVTPDRLIIYQKPTYDFFKVANFSYNSVNQDTKTTIFLSNNDTIFFEVLDEPLPKACLDQWTVHRKDFAVTPLSKACYEQKLLTVNVVGMKNEEVLTFVCAENLTFDQIFKQLTAKLGEHEYFLATKDGWNDSATYASINFKFEGAKAGEALKATGGMGRLDEIHLKMINDEKLDVTVVLNGSKKTILISSQATLEDVANQLGGNLKLYTPMGRLVYPG